MKSVFIKSLSIILICSTGIIVYSNSFQCSFHFDDFYYITDNHFIRNIQDLLKIWNYDPTRFVIFLSFALNYHFHQSNVFGYHLFNLAVHLGSAILVWWLVLLTLSTPAMKEDKITSHANLVAFCAGMIFISHPVQTEAVTYIWQRATSLSAFFYLASVCLYVKSRLLQKSGALAMAAYISSLIAAIAAMYCKENAITLPIMILSYEFCFLRTKRIFNWKYAAPFLCALFIIPLTGTLTRSINFQELHLTQESSVVISRTHYLLTEFRVMVTYIRLLFLPVNQNLDYDYPISRSIFEFPTLFSFLFLFIILVTAQRLFLKYRLVSFAILWFFLTLSVESSFIPFNDVIFEHRLYLPLAGYSMFLASGLDYLKAKRSIKLMIIPLSMIIMFNSILAYQRNKIWKDEFTLWNDVIRKSPHKARGYNNRAIAFFKEGRLEDAMSDFNRDIAIDPKGFNAYTYLGCIFGQKNDLIKAISEFTKALEINPLYAAAYYNRAGAYYELEEYNNAWEDAQKAEKLGYPAIEPGFIDEVKKLSGQASDNN